MNPKTTLTLVVIVNTAVLALAFLGTTWAFLSTMPIPLALLCAAAVAWRLTGFSLTWRTVVEAAEDTPPATPEDTP